MRVVRKRALSVQQRKYGTCQAAFRSGLEDKQSQRLTANGVAFEYEKHKISYVVPASLHKYTPDFVIGGFPQGLIIETKGLFTSDDRKKMLLVKAQHPELDIRMVFSNANAPIAKGSKTTYAKWCETNGIPYAHKEIPLEWMK